MSKEKDYGGMTTKQAVLVFIVVTTILPCLFGVFLSREITRTQRPLEETGQVTDMAKLVTLDDCLEANKVEFGILAANSLEGNKVVIQHNNVTIYTPDGKVLATGHLVKPACVSALDGAR